MSLRIEGVAVALTIALVIWTSPCNALQSPQPSISYEHITSLRLPVTETYVKVTKEYSEEDLEYLARTMYGEARGEGRQGMIAVGSVILNRVNHPKFPKTVKKVVLQKSQFSVWSKSNASNATTTGKIPEQVYAYAEELLENGPINSYVYFESAKLGRRGVRIGGHTFR